MTANVLTPNDNKSALIDIIKTYQPDIFVTLESDQKWQRHLDLLSETTSVRLIIE